MLQAIELNSRLFEFRFYVNMFPVYYCILQFFKQFDILYSPEVLSMGSSCCYSFYKYNITFSVLAMLVIS